MELFARYAEFFDDVLVLDAGADDVGLVGLDQLFHLVVRDVVDDEDVLLHLDHHAVVILEAESAGLQCLDLLGSLTRVEALGIGLDLDLLDVAGVGVDLDRGQHDTAFVVVAVGEFVAGGHGEHADILEEMLVVVGAGATDEHRGGLALEAALHVLDHGPEGGHLLGDDFFGAVDELFIAEEFCDLAQRFRRLIGTDEVHFDPRDAELRLHHLGHVIDRAVAHDDVEVGRVALADLFVADVARERRGDVDAALLEELVDLPGVAADVVFAEDVDAELRLVGLVEQADHVFEHAVVGDMVTGGLGDAFVAFAGEPEDVDPKFLLGLAADGVDVVADQADRAGGVHRDGLRLEDPVGLADGGG